MDEFSENHKVLLDAHLLLVTYYNELHDSKKDIELCVEVEYLAGIINKLTKLLDDLDINYLKYYEQLD